MKPSFERVMVRVLVGLPLLSLFLGLIAWLQYGFDLPFFDDWRGYARGDIDSLSISTLFRPDNGTMAPLGVALDALAQRYLSGNSVVYQALSMVVVLGSLLALQWRLLHDALGNRLHAAMCFVLTLLMLQPGSYWGRENLAYHQALPSVFILAALALIIHPRFRNGWRLPAIFLAGLLAGLSYISGAFGACAVGVTCFGVAWVLPTSVAQQRIRWGGLALGLAGLVMSAVQYVVAVRPYLMLASADTASVKAEGGRMALPDEADFWFFYLGKLGRSLFLPADQPVLSLVLATVFSTLAVVLTVWMVRRVRSINHERDVMSAVVLLGIASMVFVYLMLVAAGRTHFRDPSLQSVTEVFVHGFTRFHFFWATLLWPWVLASGILILRGSTASASPPRVKWLLIPVLAVIILLTQRGVFDHSRQHRQEASFRALAAECLQSRLQTGRIIDCPEFNMPDLTSAYRYATKINASFVRYFPVLPTPLGVEEPAPLYRWSRDGKSAQMQHIRAGPSQSLTAQNDSQLIFRTGQTLEMANCQMLDVIMLIRPTLADTAQLFFKVPRQAAFEAAASQAVAVLPLGTPQLIHFRLDSPIGFEDELRLDPVEKAQDLELFEVEVRCRMRIEADAFFVLTPGTDKIQLENMEPVNGVPDTFIAKSDPRLVFSTGRSRSMTRCSNLVVSVSMQLSTPQLSQLFFLPRGATTFSESASVAITVQPSSKPHRVVFHASSPSGFEDQVRFDPVSDAGNFKISDLRMTCSRFIDTKEPEQCEASTAGRYRCR